MPQLNPLPAVTDVQLRAARSNALTLFGLFVFLALFCLVSLIAAAMGSSVSPEWPLCLGTIALFYAGIYVPTHWRVVQSLSPLHKALLLIGAVGIMGLVGLSFLAAVAAALR